MNSNWSTGMSKWPLHHSTFLCATLGGKSLDTPDIEGEKERPGLYLLGPNSVERLFISLSHLQHSDTVAVKDSPRPPSPAPPPTPAPSIHIHSKVHRKEPDTKNAAVSSSHKQECKYVKLHLLHFLSLKVLKMVSRKTNSLSYMQDNIFIWTF